MSQLNPVRGNYCKGVASLNKISWKDDDWILPRLLKMALKQSFKGVQVVLEKLG